jgi:hypothetical protein
MTVRLQYRRECDRCAHPFEDAVIHDAKDIPERTGPRLRFFQNEDLCFDWHDLCPDCVKVVAGLMDRLRLTVPPKKKALTTVVEPLPSEESVSSPVSGNPEMVV